MTASYHFITVPVKGELMHLSTFFKKYVPDHYKAGFYCHMRDEYKADMEQVYDRAILIEILREYSSKGV